MTTTGRTYWWAKDSGWWRREHIVELGEEFGAAGPAVMDWLSCEAKAQNNGGWVKTGYKSVARGSFVDVVTVRHVVSRAVTLGSLDEFKDDEPRFQCRISGWNTDQQRARAAVRQATQRDKKAANVDDSENEVTPSHVSSRAVTLRHVESPTGTGTEELHPPNPPGGNRKSDLRKFDEQVQDYTSVLGIDHAEGWQCVKGAITAGAGSNDEVIAYVRQWRPDVLSSEAAA